MNWTHIFIISSILISAYSINSMHEERTLEQKVLQAYSEKNGIKSLPTDLLHDNDTFYVKTFFNRMALSKQPHNLNEAQMALYVHIQKHGNHCKALSDITLTSRTTYSIIPQTDGECIYILTSWCTKKDIEMVTKK